ncbi:MAG TPA: hypothetical protein P5079_11625, partial [Elusimicrobiota bacterium]|nr:hypothetical protein [Elusimicrobiota bacterium]
MPDKFGFFSKKNPDPSSGGVPVEPPTGASVLPADRSVLPGLQELEAALLQEETRSQEAFQKLLEEQKTLLEKIQESAAGSGTDRETFSQEIKTLQEETAAALHAWETRIAADREQWAKIVEEKSRELGEGAAKALWSQGESDLQTQQIQRLKEVHEKAERERREILARRLEQQRQAWRERLEKQQKESAALQARLEEIFATEAAYPLEIDR